LVSITDILLVSGIGLALFFREDLGKFLEGFKGFGQVNLPDVKLPLSDVSITVPDFGIPEAFAETGKVAGETGAGIVGAISETSKAIEEAGRGAGEVVFQAGVESREAFDKSIEETQKGFEQFGQDVQTNLETIGTGITDLFGGIFPTKEITVVSEATPIITSRRAGTETRFGGQTAPKEILTKETATTPELIVSEQPDLSLVSPFLTQFQKDPIEEPTLITSRRTLTTGGR